MTCREPCGPPARCGEAAASPGPRNTSCFSPARSVAGAIISAGSRAIPSRSAKKTMATTGSRLCAAAPSSEEARIPRSRHGRRISKRLAFGFEEIRDLQKILDELFKTQWFYTSFTCRTFRPSRWCVPCKHEFQEGVSYSPKGGCYR